ncbi:tyrosine N-monooxygenase-like [Hordeum vulgare subsp. vulgare]|uniref:tyrosine N-monooxygenase-like n=1 Tax=Hordeum vulgare subsp. vulgare TaxID=112509 RepID=UPI000296EBD4|nr:tyrosine N-monooxygenase-like [Hordeum vulgare subsp. vulgare]
MTMVAALGLCSSSFFHVVVMVAVMYVVRRLCSSAPGALPPGPCPWPVVGSLPELKLFNKLPAFRWIHQVMEKMNTDIACFRLGGVHVIPITCPRIAREVLKKQDEIFASRPETFASCVASGGYVEAALAPFGVQSTKMRRVLTSDIISPSRHKWLHDKRVEEADNISWYIYNLTGGEEGGNVDVRHLSRHYCGNVIRRLLFGTRYFGEAGHGGGPGKLEMEHMDASFAAQGILYSFCISDYLPSLLGLDLDGHEKIVKDANAVLDRLHDGVIDERWKQWKAGERGEVQDFLDVLITRRDPRLTMEEVKAQAKLINLAAVDNPSNAAEWALAEMVKNPELLGRAAEELDRVVGRERQVQESDIPQLNYVKACIREAFRLHPIAPFNVPHVALADTVVAGYRVPKGSHVLLSRLGLGRNPAIWNDPLRFNPDRHLEGAGGNLELTENELRFISFSTGRRGCVAPMLGTAMTVMLFGRLLHGFTWSKPAEMPDIQLTESHNDLSMAKPLVLHAKPRLPLHLYRP